MQKRMLKLSGILITALIFFQSCTHDLRTKLVKREGLTVENTNKGKRLLDRAWKKQGFDKLDSRSVYSFRGKDTWQGMLGRIGKIWPDMKAEMDFKYQVGSFDGQIAFVGGKQNGDIVGLQNWNYYEIKNNEAVFSDKKLKRNKRKVFGIAAFQYFTEMISRLRQAPIISYAGQKEFKGQKYDLVFCTWEKPEPHMEHDQYMAWINQETGIMDYTEFTLRDNYLKMPGAKAIGGAVEYADLKEVDGVLIPHQQYIYGIKMKKKHKKNLHQLSITNFQFDNFDAEELRVDKSIEKGGDFKPTKK